jgi:hypothetical protein
MKTYNDLGEVYFVECSNCEKHSTEVNDYWNDDDELFICDCGHPMFDGWEDEKKEKEKQEIKDQFKTHCEGDNNGDSFLSSQFSDWVEVKLNYSTAIFDDNYETVTVEGYIPRLAVFERDGKLLSAWGDAHEFDKTNVKEDEDEMWLEDVRGIWTFSIKKAMSFQEDNPIYEFEEIDADEINETEPEETEKPTEEAAIEYHVKCDNCGKIFNTTKIIIDNIEAGTEACPNCGVTGCLVKFQPTEGTAKIKAKLSHGVDHGFTGKQAIGLIVIGISVNGIEVDPAHFFHAEKVEKIRQGQKGFLFSYDIGYRECLKRYPEIVNFQNGEKPTGEKPMPEHVRDYVTFEELSLAHQNKVIRDTFKNPEEIKNNLYHADGSPACMTIQERKDWYASEKKTETVYRYRLSPEWNNAVVWGRTFEQALSRRGKLYEKYHILNGAEMQGKSIIINKIIEVKQTDNFSIVLGEKTGPFPGFIATVELEDGRITEVSAVVEDSLILR